MIVINIKINKINKKIIIIFRKFTIINFLKIVKNIKKYLKK